VRRQEDLQLKLRERYRRLLVADHDAYLPQLRLIRDFMREDRIVTGLLAEARRVEPGLDEQSLLKGDFHRRVAWAHTTEGGQAVLIWRLMQAIADGEVGQGVLWNVRSGTSNINDKLRTATESIFAPLFDYLIERVGEQSSVLHALERYVRIVEWFDRDQLISDYDTDPQRGEAIFNRHLRRFLFREGIDMPFTEAQSPSGESDALAALHTDDSLVCELKVYDAASRGRRHVATGVHQALLYAQDYGKSEAYLVVVNVSGRPVQIEGDGDDKQWPPYLDLAGVRVHIVLARARRLKSASKSGPASVVKFSQTELTDPDSE
jgi:hypothetical protein